MGAIRTPTAHHISAIEDSRRWAGFRHRPDDVFISTPPKSGTTWMQGIVSSLLWPDGDAPGHLGERSPWVDVRFRPVADVLARARCAAPPAVHQDAQPSRLHADLRGVPLRRGLPRRPRRIDVVGQPSPHDARGGVRHAQRIGRARRHRADGSFVGRRLVGAARGMAGGPVLDPPPVLVVAAPSRTVRHVRALQRFERRLERRDAAASRRRSTSTSTMPCGPRSSLDVVWTRCARPPARRGATSSGSKAEPTPSSTGNQRTMARRPHRRATGPLRPPRRRRAHRRRSGVAPAGIDRARVAVPVSEPSVA